MSNSPDKIFDASMYQEETRSDRLARKSKEAPFMPIGIAALVGALGFGAYKYRHRGEMSPSLFFMQLRVSAQGMVVAALSAGVVYTLVRDFVLPKFSASKDK